MEQYSGYSTKEREELSDRAVRSLRFAIHGCNCEMERPSDWIAADPDFSSLLRSSAAFRDFVDDQKRRDYPGAKLESDDY